MQTLRDVAVHAQENTKNNMDGQTLSFLIEQDNLNQDVDNIWFVKVSVIFISMLKIHFWVLMQFSAQNFLNQLFGQCDRRIDQNC